MKMKIDIDEVKKSDYTLEEVLAVIYVEVSRIGSSIPYTSVNDMILKECTNKELLIATPDGFKLSGAGKKLIKTIIGVKESTFTGTLNFKAFWEAYPPTDKHGMWIRTRALRNDKDKSEERYNKIVKGGVTHEDLMRALKWDVKERKSTSITSNKLSFMKASTSWLNQADYDIILEELKLSAQPDAPEEGAEDWTSNMI